MLERLIIIKGMMSWLLSDGCVATCTNLSFIFVLAGPSSFHSPLTLPLKERESSTVRRRSLTSV